MMDIINECFCPICGDVVVVDGFFINTRVLTLQGQVVGFAHRTCPIREEYRREGNSPYNSETYTDAGV